VQLHLATTPRVAAADGTSTLLSPRDAALLAWLAIEGATHRLRLAALLWPDSSPEAARNALRQRLFQMRKQFRADLVTGSAILALAEGMTHDLDESDDVLGAVGVGLGQEYAAWLARVREQRTQRARSRLQSAADAAEGARDWSTALDLTQRLLALDPLREDAHRRLMRVHYLAGDRAAALHSFDHCERLLKDEVGTRPDAETLQLLAQVEAGDRPVALAHAVPASVLRPPRLIGRAAEWNQMQAAWQEGRALLLAGEGGLGKSRLVGDFAASLGPAVITVGARPGDALLPYALLSRLLRALLRGGLQPQDSVRRELARLLPELGDAGTAQSATERTRFVNAVEAALEQAAAEGVAGVLVDDLHLADGATAELLASWSGPGKSGPGLRWVHAFRDAELPASTRALFDELVNSHRALTLALRPLSVTQVGELLASLCIDGVGGDTQAQALHRRTGGNPLYLLEAVKAQLTGAADGGTALPAVPAVGQLILQRIGRLTPMAIKLARCAAVAGQDFSATLASDVLHAAPLDLTDAWNELEAAQVLRDGGFAHDLIYEAALASVPAPIACALHAQIAAFLEAHHGDAAHVAAHWIAAGERRRAVPHLTASARLAMSRFRYAEAMQGHAQAAEILEESGEADQAFDSWFLAAEAIGTLGDAPRLAPLAERMEALAASDAQVAKAALVRGNVLIEAGHMAACLQVSERGLQAARRARLPELESDLLYMIGVVQWDRREVARAVAAVDQAIRIRRNLPPETLRQDHVVTMITMVQGYGTMLGGAGRFDEAMSQVMESYGLAAEAGLPQNMLGAAGDLVLRVGEYGDLPGALLWAERGVRAAHSYEANVNDLRRFWLARAGALILAGRWGDAIDQYDTLMAHEKAGGGSRVRPDIVARLAYLQGLLGRRDLGLKAARAELARETLTPVQQLWLEVTLMTLGEPTDVPVLLDRVAGIQDIGLRARMLVRVAPHADPATVLPLLGVTATTMHEGGLKGQWVTLQARIGARLAAAGRHKEAAAAAHGALEAAEAGIAATVPYADFVADLRSAFAHQKVELAHSLRLRGEAWIQGAAATVPAQWRESCRTRSLLLPPLQMALPRR